MTLLKCDARMSVRYEHIPVLANEVVAAFAGSPRSLIIDGTLGLGGHSELLLKAYPETHVVGLDWDTEALHIARTRLASFGNRFEAVETSYARLPEFLAERSQSGVDGILLDLGLSSMQLQDTDRGFSFLRPGPLDMRMAHTLPRTAWDILTAHDEVQLARLFRMYGEEPSARRIAHALKEAVHLGTLKNDAWQVAECIRTAVPRAGRHTDPATRVFQALRIVVNGELDNVDQFLEALPSLLNCGGRAALIAFHSLEDRRVKTAFQHAAKGCICPPQIPQCVCRIEPWARLVQRKAIQASEEEQAANPRSRSARLRVLEKL